MENKKISFSPPKDLHRYPITSLNALQKDKSNIYYLRDAVNFEIVDTKILKARDQKNKIKYYDSKTKRHKEFSPAFIVEPRSQMPDFYFGVSEIKLGKAPTADVYMRPISDSSTSGLLRKDLTIKTIIEEFYKWRDIINNYFYLIHDITDAIFLFNESNLSESFTKVELLQVGQFIDSFTKNIVKYKDTENEEIILSQQVEMQNIKSDISNLSRTEVRLRVNKVFDTIKKMSYDIFVNVVSEIIKINLLN